MHKTGSEILSIAIDKTIITGILALAKQGIVTRRLTKEICSRTWSIRRVMSQHHIRALYFKFIVLLIFCLTTWLQHYNNNLKRFVPTEQRGRKLTPTIGCFTGMTYEFQKGSETRVD